MVSSESIGQSPERLRVFTKWAQEQIETQDSAAHRQILDDVISSFAPYAQRIDQGSRAERHAAEARLCVLADLIETPTVNSALRQVNWAWLREWELHALDQRDTRLRCTVVFPTICTAGRLRQGDARASSPRTLAYVASWCADFLNREDVHGFLGIATSPTQSEERVQFSSLCGALYSDSSDDEDESPAAMGTMRTTRSAWMFSTPSKSTYMQAELGENPDSALDFTRRTFDGQEHCYDDPDATQALVRGEHYLQDRVKVHSQSSMLELVAIDLVKTWDEMHHYSSSPRGKIPGLRAAGDSRFFFVVNFRLSPIQLVLIFAVPQDANWLALPEGRTFQRFCNMSNEERNSRLKVLPKILDGPWLVKKSLPAKPGVVGRKLKIDYFSSDNHLEASLNCISSPIGRRLVQLCTGAGKHFSITLFFILEGMQADELPERILGGATCYHGDLSRLAER